MNNLNIKNLKRFKDYLVIENEKSKVVFQQQKKIEVLIDIQKME